MATPLYVLLYIAFWGINFKNFRADGADCNLLKPEEKAACFDKGALSSTDDSEEVSWIEKCVVKYFCLQPQPGQKDFKKPLFEKDMGTPYFEYAAMRIEKFFLRNKDWKTTKSKPEYKANNCVKLLAITDARYLYVTYVLYIKSGKKLTACKDSNGKFPLPTYVCFPRPYGSATCTSDYDVGLIGRTSGELTSAFNMYFKEKFQKPSEEVFDTNVYAFTLEYAMPELFTGMTGFFKMIVPYLDLKPWYQMKELAGAYFKMYKFNEKFYNEFKTNALASLGEPKTLFNIPDRKGHFKKSIENLEKWDSTKAVKNIEDLRNAHNAIYQQQVVGAQNHFDKQYYDDIVQYMYQMSVALIYAAEAYHTRGAMRHVVGDIQKESDLVRSTTTVMDHWVSMIENWADANKEYNHCNGIPVNGCLQKISKYLYRTFDAMKKIYTVLSKMEITVKALRAANLVVEYPSQLAPEKIANNWLELKKANKKIEDKDIRPFLNWIGCSESASSDLKLECMQKIQDKIMEYNKILVSATARDAEAIQDIFILMPNGQKKDKPAYK